MPDEFDQQISAAESELKKFEAAMQKVRDKFIEGVAQHFAEWFPNRVQEEVTVNDPDRTRAIGEDGIAQLKDVLKKFQGQSRAIIDSYLRDDDLWWPKWRADSADGLDDPTYHPSREAVLHVAGHLGPVLRRFGYLSRSWDIWEQNGEPYCHEDEAAPDHLFTVLKEYAVISRQASEEQQRVERLRTQKSQAAAKKLWDEA